MIDIDAVALVVTITVDGAGCAMCYVMLCRVMLCSVVLY